MKKNKNIIFRVSEDFYELVSGYCDYLGISMTSFIIDSILCKEYVLVKEEPESQDLQKHFHAMSNNVNQIARTLNAINRELKATADKELLVENMDFRAFAIELQRIHERLKAIDQQCNLKDRGLYHYSKQRQVYEDIEKYLKDNEQEIYLKDLRDRTRAI